MHTLGSRDVSAWSGPWNDWWARSLVVALAPALGLTAVRALERDSEVARAWHGWVTPIDRQDHLDRLLDERRQLVDQIDRMVDDRGHAVGRVQRSSGTQTRPTGPAKVGHLALVPGRPLEQARCTGVRPPDTVRPRGGERS